MFEHCLSSCPWDIALSDLPEECRFSLMTLLHRANVLSFEDILNAATSDDCWEAYSRSILKKKGQFLCWSLLVHLVTMLIMLLLTNVVQCCHSVGIDIWSIWKQLMLQYHTDKTNVQASDAASKTLNYEAIQALNKWRLLVKESPAWTYSADVIWPLCIQESVSAAQYVLFLHNMGIIQPDLGDQHLARITSKCSG